MSTFRSELPHRFAGSNLEGLHMPAFGGVGFPRESLYLDYASATPVELSVAEEMTRWHTLGYGNPANRLHALGEYAEHALMDARQRLSQCVGLAPEGVVFTGSATEANNLILRGLALHPKRKRKRFVFSPAEHSSVTATLEALEALRLSEPIEIVPLKLDPSGDVNLEHARQVIDDDTLCVSVMDVNNETGVNCRTLPDIISHTHSRGAYVHCDAVQGFCRGLFNMKDTAVDFGVISAGKIYGPKGVAAVCLSERGRLARIEAQLTGGGQEGGRRSGTVNLAAIRAFARAAEMICSARAAHRSHLTNLEGIFLQELEAKSPRSFKRYGHVERAPGIVMLSFDATNAMKLMEHVPELCLSVGSACRTLQATPSPVLLAMGIPLEEALGSLRISFGIPTCEEDARRAARHLSEALANPF